MSQSLLTGLKRPLENTDANTTDAPPAKQAKKSASKPKKTSSGAGLCSLNKKDFGDKIKDCMTLEKYAIHSTTFTVDMDVAFMRSFFGGAGVAITPSDYDESTPVIVANLNNTKAGEVFGVSKIKNGNRVSTYHLRSMVVILYPSKKKAQVFVSV